VAESSSGCVVWGRGGAALGWGGVNGVDAKGDAAALACQGFLYFSLHFIPCAIAAQLPAPRRRRPTMGGSARGRGASVRQVYLLATGAAAARGDRVGFLSEFWVGPGEANAQWHSHALWPPRRRTARRPPPPNAAKAARGWALPLVVVAGRDALRRNVLAAVARLHRLSLCSHALNIEHIGRSGNCGLFKWCKIFGGMTLEACSGYGLGK
jgi:hypothetical protein